MRYTKNNLTPVTTTGKGVSPYESPSCISMEVSVNGPLCQSNLADTDVNLGNSLDLGFGSDL